MKTARGTSIEAYRDIIESGELGKKQKVVLEALILANKINGAVSAGELFNEFLKGKSLVFSNCRARLSELRDMGVIEERAKRACQYTNRKVLTWHITGRKPEKVNRIPKADRLALIKDFMAVMLAQTSEPKAKQDLKLLWQMVKEL